MSSGRRFLELDVFRGVAAMWVMMFHFTLRYDQAFLNEPIPLKPFLDGTYGVQLFFMISGFVILLTLQRSRSAIDFAVHRFARLYPAYWLSLLLACLLITQMPLPNQVLTPAQVVANATMAQKFLFIGDIDGVYWSLAVELAFYALMVGVFLSRAVHRILLVCCGWLVVAALWRVGEAYGVYLPGRVRELLVVQYAQFFVCGIVFFDAWSREDWRPIHSFLMVASVLTQASMVGAWKTIPMILFCALFALAITGRLAFLRHRVLIWLGVISYPLYLIHQMVGYRVMRIGDEMDLPRFVVIPFAMLMSIAVAAIINRTIEKPALRSIRGWYDRGRRKQPELVVVEPASQTSA
jgi:peptidoglycan/LPS O-acetylase OafA/YrhL